MTVKFDLSQADLRIQAPSVPERQKNLKLGSQHIESIGNEVYDSDCLKLINEYFYGVRIYPGQDPTHGEVLNLASKGFILMNDGFDLNK
jgi:hypothetical protein